MTNLDYWANSPEYDARRVRQLIWDWLEAGGDRNHDSDVAFLSDIEVYKRAVAVCGYEWDVGRGDNTVNAAR